MKNFFLSLQFFFIPFLLTSLQSVGSAPKSEQEQPTVCTLPAPSSINGQVINSSTVDLSWAEVSGAYAYFLVVLDNGQPFLQTTVFGTNRTLGGLTSGHTYHCIVAGMCDGSQVSSFIIGYDTNP